MPAPLPPSVEQNYRKKCIELKRRMNEVDESNDAYRLRKVRLNRGIMKLRLERAFMLEQLAKRTSVNVEDSEGSPSPPPTVITPSPPYQCNETDLMQSQKRSPYVSSADTDAQRTGPTPTTLPGPAHNLLTAERVLRLWAWAPAHSQPSCRPALRTHQPRRPKAGPSSRPTSRNALPTPT